MGESTPYKTIDDCHKGKEGGWCACALKEAVHISKLNCLCFTSELSRSEFIMHGKKSFMQCHFVYKYVQAMEANTLMCYHGGGDDDNDDDDGRDWC